MNKNEAMEKIKSTLKGLMKFSKEIGVETKMGTYELTDGTKITCEGDDLAVGEVVYQLDDQGNQTPLEAGTYVINDGRSITVDEKGSITELATAEDAPQEETETPADSLEQSKETKMDDGLPEDGTEDAPAADGDIESRVADLESQLAEVLTILNKLGDGQNEVNEQMMSKIVEISREPGDEPIRLQKKGYEAFDKSSSKLKKQNEAIQDLRDEIKRRRALEN
jgi:hypothetical protein